MQSSFILSLHESGLIDLETWEEKSVIRKDQLQLLETFTRLHYDLDINLPGIEAISHLLDRVNQLQQRVQQLQNKLTVYE